jgi:transposase InsO family protein
MRPRALDVASAEIARDRPASLASQREGWLYLAVVLDLFTLKVVGWAMRDHVPQKLAIAALTMAIQRQRPARGCSTTPSGAVNMPLAITARC